MRTRNTIVSKNLFVPLSLGHGQLYRIILIALSIIALIPILFADSLAVFSVFFSSFVLLSLRALPLLVGQARYGLFHPVVFFSTLWLLRSLPSLISDSYKVLVYGISSVVLTHHDALIGLSTDHLNWLLAASIGLTVLGTLAYYAGFWFGPKIELPSFNFKVASLPLVKIFIATITSMAIFTWYIYSRGGVSEHLLSWQDGRFAALRGDGFFLQTINVASLSCLLWFSLSRTSVKRAAFWILVVASLGMKFVATGSRSEVIFSLGLGALVWMLRERKIIPIRAVLILLLTVLLFGALGSFRAGITGQGVLDLDRLTDVSGAFERAFGIADEKGELSSRSGRQNGVLPILDQVPENEGLLFGSSYLAVLSTPIPRALWSDKPRSIGAEVNAKFFNYDNAFSIPPGPVGEAFWNFHIPGVFLVFFVFGVFHQSLYRWFLLHGSHRAAMLLYVMTLFLFSAPDSLSLSKWIFSIMPLVFLLWWCGFVSWSRRS